MIVPSKGQLQQLPTWTFAIGQLPQGKGQRKLRSPSLAADPPDVRLQLGTAVAANNLTSRHSPSCRSTTSSSRRVQRSSSNGKIHHDSPYRYRSGALSSLWPILAAALVSALVTYTILQYLRVGQILPAAVAGSSRDWGATISLPDINHIDAVSATAAAAAAQAAAAAAVKSSESEQHLSKPKLQPLPIHSNSSSQAAEGLSRRAGGHVLPGRKLVVALVNDAPYHLEIVAGFLHLLGHLPEIEVVWYQAGQQTPDGFFSPVQLLDAQGFSELLGYFPHMRPTTDVPPKVDFAIFVSPEYFEANTKVSYGCKSMCSWMLQMTHTVRCPVFWRSSGFWGPCTMCAGLMGPVFGARHRTQCPTCLQFQHVGAQYVPPCIMKIMRWDLEVCFALLCTSL